MIMRGDQGKGAGRTLFSSHDGGGSSRLFAIECDSDTPDPDPDDGKSCVALTVQDGDAE